MDLSKGRVAAVIAVLIIIAGGGAALWHPAIAPVTSHAAFPPEQIARGAELAAIGDCAVCHTAAGGRPYAGGRGVPTPFGTVYATNITPDPDTGIGQWSEAAFQRAMRDGIDRSGHHLYPVLPYPHFTRASDDDIAAMYAFLMTRAAVHANAPPDRLPFPFDNRFLLAGWNLLYLSPGPWHPEPAHDAAWNRGDYLVEAIGHCGACHTPHNALGAEKDAQTLAGGEAENWYAPPLQAASPATQPLDRGCAGELPAHRLRCPSRRRGRPDDGGDRGTRQCAAARYPGDGGLHRVTDAEDRPRKPWQRVAAATHRPRRCSRARAAGAMARTHR